MFKYFFKKFNAVKSFIGKYVPAPIKSEYHTMKNGIDDLTEKFHDNYFKANLSAKLRGKTKANAIAEGIVSAIGQTRITKNEIPPLFAIAGGCSFYPGTTEAGYAVGKLLTSKPATKVLNISKKAVISTYNSVLRI